jgi:predicted RNase H-like HicB family nuclease
MLTEYIQAAMRHARCETLPDDGGVYCDILPLPGIWSNRETRADALTELRDVLEEWIAVGLALGQTLPAVDGIDISVQSVR